MNEEKNIESGKTSGTRILFIGNSITRHKPKPEIGWYNDWGMAATAIENDYVHLLMKFVRSYDADAVFEIAQVAVWEQEYWNDVLLEEHKAASLFAPDIIVTKIGENVSQSRNAEYPFILYYKKLLDFLNPQNKATVIAATSFWRVGSTDEATRTIAQERGYPIVELGHLGRMDSMKALYENKIIRNHPSDAGMAAIAAAIWEPLYTVLKERTDVK